MITRPEIRTTGNTAARPPQAPAVELKSVTAGYRTGDPPAVSDLSFHIDPGEVLALLGPSGSGKTTALRLIAGFLTPRGGRVLLNGKVVAQSGSALPPERRGVGVVFQDYALFPHLSVRRNVAFGLNRLSSDERRRLTDEALDRVGLTGYAERRPSELSGGQQQRVALARALAPKPVVVLLDEPLSSLDPALRLTLREEVAAILREVGSAALLVTHDQDEAMYLANRVAVIEAGRCRQIGRPEEIYLRPANRFVAEFMGRTDFIAGVVAPEGIETELGLLRQAPDFAPGTRVDVAVRPDDVRIEPSPSGPGLVVERHFEGVSFLYHVVLPSGRPVHSLQPHTRLIEPGTPVDVWLDAGHDLPSFEASAALSLPGSEKVS
ncbi:MAG: ABC transporter ATP-binding protein [Thermoleophilia bacterium]